MIPSSTPASLSTNHSPSNSSVSAIVNVTQSSSSPFPPPPPPSTFIPKSRTDLARILASAGYPEAASQMSTPPQHREKRGLKYNDRGVLEEYKDGKKGYWEGIKDTMKGWIDGGLVPTPSWESQDKFKQGIGILGRLTAGDRKEAVEFLGGYLGHKDAFLGAAKSAVDEDEGFGEYDGINLVKNVGEMFKKAEEK